MWCGHGRLAVRWPVWQVVLFNMSVRWSNHSVWCCFSFSIHAYIWPNQQSSLQVATHCPHAEKVQPLVHHFFIIFVVGREKEGGGKLVFYFTGTNICYRCLVLYMLQYGLSALVNWVVSGGLILAVWVWSENDFVAAGLEDLWSELELSYPKTVGRWNEVCECNSKWVSSLLSLREKADFRTCAFVNNLIFY